MAFDVKQTCIDHIDGDKHITVTASENWSVKKILALSETHPDLVEITHTNPDGSLLAHIPKGWLKISPPRKMSEAQRESARQRMLDMHKT